MILPTWVVSVLLAIIVVSERWGLVLLNKIGFPIKCFFHSKK